MLPRSRAGFFLVLLIGCGRNVPQGEPATGVATPTTPLVLLDSSMYLGNPAREPMVVVHPSGTLFASGYGGEARGYRGADPTVPRIVKSLDLGKHWTPIDVGGRREGAIGGVSDLDMAVAPDGTLYHTALLFDPEAWAGIRVGMGTSRDGGAPFPIDVAARAEGEFDTGGEYLGAVFLPDGSIGVVFPIQNYSASRFGFGWRRYVARQ